MADKLFVYAVASRVLSAVPPHLRNPLNQFLLVHHNHYVDKNLLVAFMHGQEVILMEDDLNALLQDVQSCFNQQIVHDASEKLAVPLLDSDPEVFTPAA